MMHFDFILFENYHLAYHHKIDVVLIAKMLKSQGLNVAIFDIYHEDKEDEIEGIPVIHWQSKQLPYDDSWMLKKHSVLKIVRESFRQSYQQYLYMKEVKAFIEEKADNFYCGSYHNGISTLLFSINKPCYWWGLRSDRFRFTIRKLFPSPLAGLHILFERKKFLKNQYQRLFVSNNIILEEHIKLGIPRNRIIIREERCINKKSNPRYNDLSPCLTFLTIGQLRPDKRIDLTVREFLTSSIKESEYVLAGTSQESYEEVITPCISGHNNIRRINEFLDHSKYNDIISQSHFIILADRKQKCSITNGTMMESFINYRPVIAPNYDPYKFYVEKYGLGILYNPDMNGDLCRAINEASKIDCKIFQKNIDIFLNTILFDKLAVRLIVDLNALNA